MIRIQCGFRNSFRKEIEIFCNENNIVIDYRQCMGTYDSYSLGCEGKDFNALEKYNNELELKRKSKSLWFKLFN